MGLFKRCDHKGRNRDRCAHPWWGSFKHGGVLHRVPLSKWADEDIKTKQHAEVVYERFRQAARDGRVATATETQGPLTFDQLADVYIDRYVKPRALRTAKAMEYRLKPLRAFFGSRQIGQIKTADVEDFIAERRLRRRVNRQDDRLLSPVSINRDLQTLRAVLNWAVGREYLDRTPFRRGSQTLIRLFREDNTRRRRISEDEEATLLNAAPSHLRAMMIIALDAGLRRGEMLAVRFDDIDGTSQLITVRGEIAKSGITRHVPIATMRLKAVLEWQRLDAAGEHKPNTALVFSDEAGEAITTFRRAWVTTVLKAHGVQPRWSKGAGWKGLTPECQEAFRRIDLHWHDLRHEYASRLVERGAPLSQVRDLLGHASITTTERYDNQTLAALKAAAQRLESGKRFTFVSHSASREEKPKLESDEQKSQKLLQTEGVSDLAGRQGFEPRYRGPEPRVLPLDDLPVPVAAFCARELLIVANPKLDRQAASGTGTP